MKVKEIYINMSKKMKKLNQNILKKWNKKKMKVKN